MKSKLLLSRIKIDREIITFGDIEVENINFTNLKAFIQLKL